MKNIFHRGSKKSGIFNLTVYSLIVYITCIICIFLLYRFDTDSVNLNIVNEFIDNEEKYLYNGEFNSLQYEDSRDFLHTITYDYIGTRFSGLYTDSLNDIVDMDSIIPDSVDSMESAEEFISNIIPDNIDQGSNITKMFIYKYAYYDLLSCIDTECEDYWQISSFAWSSIVFYSGFDGVEFYDFLYRNMDSIVISYILIMIVTLAVDASYLMLYYFRICNTKGAIRNDVHRET